MEELTEIMKEILSELRDINSKIDKISENKSISDIVISLEYITCFGKYNFGDIVEYAGYIKEFEEESLNTIKKINTKLDNIQGLQNKLDYIEQVIDRISDIE